MNVWEATAGFILSLVFIVVASLIGWLDPWNTEMPWVNTIAVAAACVFAVGTSGGLIQYTGGNGNRLFWAMLVSLGIYLFLGGFAASGVAMSTTYDTLVLTVYVVYPVAMIFSMMTMFFIGGLLEARERRSYLSRG